VFLSLVVSEITTGVGYKIL